jgi:hypothetical protein
MKTKFIITTLVIATALSAPCLNGIFAANTNNPQAKLQAQARISEAKAREIALTKAPGGIIQSSELEEENGHLIWSFDISTPGTKNISEVQVDAKDGTIVSSTIETPKDQKKEAAADKKAAKKAKKEKADDEKDEKKSN